MPFYNDIKSQHNVVISFLNNPIDDFGVFAKGYHLAANRLAEDFISKTGFRDYEGYPIVFLYRHALELNLKNISYCSMRLCVFKNIDLIDNKLYYNHDLFQLAELATKLLLKLFPDDLDIDKLVNTIKTVTREFAEIDPKSYSYRYPIDKNGNYSTKKHQVVNILSIYNNMDKLLTDLETVNFYLDIETDQAQELYELLNNFSLY